MLIDSFGRKVDYLRISVTDRCNLRCVYCMPDNGIANIKYHEDLLTFEEIASVVKASIGLGINKFRLTGGEPLVRKDIVRLVEMLTAIPGLEDLSMTTNGIFLKEYAFPLKKAGLSRLNVSLDSLDPARYKMLTRYGELDRVTEGLEEAVKAGFSPIKLNIVLLDNMQDEELYDLLALTFEKEFNVRFIEFMPLSSFYGVSNGLSPDAILNFAKKLGVVEKAKVYGNGPAKSYRFTNARGSFGFITPMSNKFCSSCNRLRLTSDGFMKSCLHSNIALNIRDTLREGVPQERISELIRLCVEQKPKEHLLENKTSSEASEYLMCQIGG